MADYYADAKSDAKTCAQEYLDTIFQQVLDEGFGSVSDDLLNDYSDGDSYHHENHVDRDYNLSEAAEILNELSQYEETDSGLWQGLEPRRAIAAQAAYTYGNAVYSLWQEIIERINDDSELEDLLNERVDAEDDVNTVGNIPGLEVQIRERISAIISEF